MRINGSTVLITGANRGLGACLVRQVLAGGAEKVYTAARNRESMSAAVVSDSRVTVIELDIDDQDSVDRAARIATDVNVLVNNAGVLGFGDVLGGDVELFERDMRTNYFGTLRMARAFAPVLAGNAPAVLANVLTLIALAPMAGMAGYCASKAAAHSMTQALRASLHPLGVDVLGAYPGGIDTEMLASVDADKADPWQVATRIVAAIDAGERIVWPDDTSAGAGSVYVSDPLGLESMLAG